jgi:hypothetical protein
MSLNKLVDTITEADLKDLIDRNEAERKTIEYKATLLGKTDAERKEFCADVSSFANAAGGWLLYGIPANDGVPVNLDGIQIDNADGTVLTLENCVRDGIRPRLAVTTAVVLLASGPSVVVMHIPRSYAAPHMVTIKDSSRFFTRDSNGKHPLDVDELRAAFARSGSIAERMRDFRRQRIADLIAGETPVKLQAGAKIVLHSVPFTAFDPGAGARYDLSRLRAQSELFGWLQPINMGITHHRYNFEGFLAVGDRSKTAAFGYVQVFRTGGIEAVDAFMLREDKQTGRVIPSTDFERGLVTALPRYLAVQQALGVEPPVAVLLTLVGVRGYNMAVSRANSDVYDLIEIERDVLDLPEVLIDRFDITTATAPQHLKPLFDIVWNATGYVRSLNYDEAGNWAPK